MCEFQFGISAAVLESNGNLKVHCQIIAPGTAHHNTTPPPSSAYAYFTYTYFIVLVSLLHVLLEQRC